jgi:hypothetical protein
MMDRDVEQRLGEMGSVGVLQGVSPGRNIHHAGVLDLRGVPSDQVAQVEEIGSADVMLLDEQNRNALRGVNIHHVGSILTASADERVIVTPQMDLDRQGIEFMPDEQRLLFVGNVFIRPDVSPDLVARKFAFVRVIGILVAGAGALGALTGRLHFSNGVTVSLPEDTGPLVRNTGEVRMMPEYLDALPDDATYINFGEVKVSGGVSVSVIQQKIRAYYNLGETAGKPEGLAALHARCQMNTGSFEYK